MFHHPLLSLQAFTVVAPTPNCGQDPELRAPFHLAVWIAVFVVVGVPFGPMPARAPRDDAEPKKLALIVAVADYPRRGGYPKLSSDNDIPLVRGAMVRHGFAEEDISVLLDEQATRAGIFKAIEEHLLAAAEPGDVVFIHYSGHGHQITDQDGDEIDGYDEILVPFDAPSLYHEGYEGELHIRDDELNEVVETLRQKVAPDGNVVVSLDACHTGSATRGPWEAAVRGMPEPLGPPAAQRPGTRGEGDGGGFYERPGGSTRGGAGEDLRTPYIVFSAARHDEVNWETKDIDRGGISVGSLSLALSQALATADAETTYRVVFERVKEIMAALVPMQTPQLEGTADVELFSGTAMAQAPYFEVRNVESESELIIEGGTLLGLLPGTRIEFHRSGVSDPGGSLALARGSIEQATTVASLVRLDGPVDRAPLEDSWAFVSEYAFSELSVRVFIEPSVDLRSAGAIRGALAEFGIMEVVDSDPDVTIRQVTDEQGERVAVYSAADEVELFARSRESRSQIGALIAKQLQQFARNRYLTRLTLADPKIDVQFDIVPATHRYDFSGACEGSDTLATASALTRGNQWELSPGDGFLLRLRNEGERAAYVTILDLMPDGQIAQLYPLVEWTGEDNLIPAGAVYLIDLCYEIEEPYGLEVLKLFATREPVNFQSVLSREVRAAQPNPLERILGDANTGTRSALRTPSGTGSTFGQTLRIVPKVDR